MKSIMLILFCFSTSALAYTWTEDREVYINSVAEDLKSTGSAIICGYTSYSNSDTRNKIGNINQNKALLEKALKKNVKFSQPQLEGSASLSLSQMCLFAE